MPHPLDTPLDIHQLRVFAALAKSGSFTNTGRELHLTQSAVSQQARMMERHFKALLMDTKNRVMRVVTVTIGTLDGSLVHPREVFKEAITASAASIIVAHNHPSGDPSPSREDKAVTLRLVECGKLLGIELLDHIIVGDNRYVSFKERGLLGV